MPKAKAKKTQPPRSSMGPAQRIAAGALLIIFLVLLAYGPVLRAGYIWDDPEYVINNQTLRTLEGLKLIWTRPGSTPQFYPLVFTTFWIEYHLWELRPFGYHLVNILLHILSSLLLWRLLSRLSLPGAWLASAIFAVHPVHVESVAWITERKNVLSGFFYLGALLAYLRFAMPGASPPASQERAWSYYALALALFICALLSKTVTCSLPVAILLLLWLKDEQFGWKDAALLIPFFLVGGALGSMTVWMEKFFVGASGAEWSLSPLGRILVAGRIPWFYAGKLLWPAELSFIYPRWRIDPAIWWQYLFPLASVAVVAALWIQRRRFGKGPLAAVLFFLATLFPALGFFDVYPMRFSFVADHFQYLASLGPIVLFASLAAKRFARPDQRHRWAALAACGLMLTAMVLKDRQQGLIYKDQETLWRDTLKKNSDAWIAHNNLAEILVARGELDDAAVHCSAALSLKDDLPEAHGNLANILFKNGKIREAVPHYEKVLQADPDNVIAHNNLAATLDALGRTEEAAAHFAEALRLRPNFANAHYNFANSLMKQGKTEEAIRHYSKAVRLKPNFPQARYKLGLALQEAGERDKAIVQYRKALRDKPDWMEVKNNLAWLLATSRTTGSDGIHEALQLAVQVNQKTAGRFPIVLDTLAASYARAGRFAEAVETTEKALELAEASEQDKLAEQIRSRMQVYLENRPYFEGDFGG